MISEEMLNIYESVASLSNEMRLSAQYYNLNRLSELELQCQSYVNQASACIATEPAHALAPQRKLASLKIIMSNDRAIRNSLEPWRMKIDRLIVPQNNRFNPPHKSNSCPC